MEDWMTLVVALVGSGAVSSIVSNRTLIDRESRKNGSIAADLDLHSRLSGNARSREDHLMAAMLLVRIRRQLVRRVFPSQGPLMLGLFALLGLSSVPWALFQSEGDPAQWVFVFTGGLILLLAIGIGYIDVWVPRALYGYLEHGSVKARPRLVRWLAAPDVRMAIAYLDSLEMPAAMQDYVDESSLENPQVGTTPQHLDRVGPEPTDE